ncbi:MAG: FkbM family methyltransferase [Bacteroidales bacterium]|nr:FkbM family methyltransferase [Bacteroidales bacterium]
MNKKSMIYRFLKRVKFILYYPVYRKRIQKIEKEQLVFYSAFVKPGTLCFDIGANVGDKTGLFRKLGAKVVAVEPQKKCCKIITKKFGNDTNVILINKGLGAEEKEMEISICEDANTISTMSEKWKTEGRFAGKYTWDKKEIVQLTTLDILIKEYGIPDYCKIDVEGFELEVLEGLTQPLPLLSFEFTAEFFNDAEKCLNHLQQLGNIEVNFFMEPGKFLFSKYATPENIIHKIKTINDKNLTGDFFVKSVM